MKTQIIIIGLVLCTMLIAGCAERLNVPIGWDDKHFDITEKTNVSCTRNSDCQTPEKYLMMSSCPYTSACIDKKCAVVCPKQKPIVGGDKDEHGCIGSAGYSWCEAKQKCLRTWEENCTAGTGSSDTGIQAKAKEFCNKENVGSVNICENYIEVNSKLLGGGAKYYDLNGTQQVTCPVVAPDSMSKKCKEIFEGKLAETFKCEKICPAEGCGECPQLVAPAPSWCKDGTVVAGVKNECGCQGPPKCLKACTEEAKICPDGSAVGRTGPDCEFAPCPNGTRIANPASVFCVAQGGKSKIVTVADGSQSGLCVLPYGIECDEWAYFRGECPAKHICTDAEKAAEVCTLEYMPTCGDDGVTYGNKCSACASKKIDSYTPGECPNKTYVSRDPEQCKVIKYVCVKDKEAFSDDFGCGCKPTSTG